MKKILNTSDTNKTLDTIEDALHEAFNSGQESGYKDGHQDGYRDGTAAMQGLTEETKPE